MKTSKNAWGWTKHYNFFSRTQKMKMQTIVNILLSFVVLTGTIAYSGADANYDLSKDKVLYTVGYAHLDTQWRWDYTTTINEFLKNTLDDNFELLEKYPGYVFNFTGSRRYALMKEYYLQRYEKLTDYIKEGRWYVSGSSVDEGDVNAASAESVIRQVLYGNQYFRTEFGVESVDYMLPDCFGFQACMPSIWAHCGLKGFSTQKLSWGCAVGMPFNIGVWKGIDGNGIICAFNPDSYVSSVENRLDTDKRWIDRINENGKKYGVFADYKYYGVGDQGGACRENDVKVCQASINHPDSEITVALASSDRMYQDITDSQKDKLPVYQGDLLLTEHSAGTLTSQAYMKRWNRKNELLAESAECAAVIAQWLGGAAYPTEKLTRSWDLVLGSQFHDILPGTSIPCAYQYSWNDEILAMNGFASVLQNSVGIASEAIDTRVKGKALLVYNPLAVDREDIVEAELKYPGGAPKAIRIYNGKGKEVPCQIISEKKNAIKFLFLANVPSMGFACYDVRNASKAGRKNTGLTISKTSLENDYYKVQINSDGDVCSIYDKENNREVLSAPAKLALLSESPEQYPAWNMDWADRKVPAAAFVEGPSKIRITENGAVRVAIEIERQAKNSIFTQQIRLSAGDAGRKVEFKTNIDWQTTGHCLKAVFPLTVENSAATYQMPLGTIERVTNHPKKYEVPSRGWFDLSDGSYGVSILENCKFGSDKPDNNTLRLTLLYTPSCKSDYLDQATQDWGRHDMVYAVFAHIGDWRDGQSQWQAKRLNQPLVAFEVPAKKGTFDSGLSIFSLSTPQVDIMAVKKAENSDQIIIRINELWGRQINDVQLSGMTKIVSAYEVDGQERKIGDAVTRDGKLVLDMTPYSLRSFAITLAKAPAAEIIKPECTPLKLEYTDDVISYDSDKTNGSMDNNGSSIPAEMLNKTIVSEDIVFDLGSFENGEKNAVSCNGQKIALPKGTFNKLYLLAAADTDTTATFHLDEAEAELSIQGWNDPVGEYDNRIWDRPFNKIDYRCNANLVGIEKGFTKRDTVAWFCTHKHNQDGSNEAYSFSYLFKYALNFPAGTRTLVLPNNPAVKIFAITAADNETDNIKPVQPLYDDFTNRDPIKLR